MLFFFLVKKLFKNIKRKNVFINLLNIDRKTEKKKLFPGPDNIMLYCVISYKQQILKIR